MAKKKITKRGRPKIEINWDLFEGLCRIQCTLSEIASTLNVSEDTIERRVKEHYKMNFAEVFKQKREGGIASLRRKGWLLAETNPAVWIFHAKNFLGMTDKQDINLSGSIDERIIFVENIDD